MSSTVTDALLEFQLLAVIVVGGLGHTISHLIWTDTPPEGQWLVLGAMSVGVWYFASSPRLTDVRCRAGSPEWYFAIAVWALIGLGSTLWFLRIDNAPAAASTAFYYFVGAGLLLYFSARPRMRRPRADLDPRITPRPGA